MLGTDYGRANSSTELDALTALKNAGGISAEMHRKIVDDNPRLFCECSQRAGYRIDGGIPV